MFIPIVSSPTSADMVLALASTMTCSYTRLGMARGLHPDGPPVSIEGDEMDETRKVQRLADAAAHLCVAYDELAAAGYGPWSAELKMLVEILDAELEWLRDEASCRVAGS